MSQALHSPLFIAAKTPKELARGILQLQGKQGGRVSIISIYFSNGMHICWYYPLQYHGEGVM